MKTYHCDLCGIECLEGNEMITSAVAENGEHYHFQLDYHFTEEPLDLCTSCRSRISAEISRILETPHACNRRS